MVIELLRYIWSSSLKIESDFRRKLGRVDFRLIVRAMENPSIIFYLPIYYLIVSAMPRAEEEKERWKRLPGLIRTVSIPEKLRPKQILLKGYQQEIQVVDSTSQAWGAGAACFLLLWAGAALKKNMIICDSGSGSWRMKMFKFIQPVPRFSFIKK